MAKAKFTVAFEFDVPYQHATDELEGKWLQQLRLTVVAGTAYGMVTLHTRTGGCHVDLTGRDVASMAAILPIVGKAQKALALCMRSDWMEGFADARVMRAVDALASVGIHVSGADAIKASTSFAFAEDCVKVHRLRAA